MPGARKFLIPKEGEKVRFSQGAEMENNQLEKSTCKKSAICCAQLLTNWKQHTNWSQIRMQFGELRRRLGVRARLCKREGLNSDSQHRHKSHHGCRCLQPQCLYRLVGGCPQMLSVSIRKTAEFQIQSKMLSPGTKGKRVILSPGTKAGRTKAQGM